jgi:hypothetical protein
MYISTSAPKAGYDALEVWLFNPSCVQAIEYAAHSIRQAPSFALGSRLGKWKVKRWKAKDSILLCFSRATTNKQDIFSKSLVHMVPLFDFLGIDF